MRELLAFGDSNTWGLVPGKNLSNRYPRDKRWTGILENRLEGVRIAEEGLCGRTTVFEDRTRPGRNGAKELPVLLESHYPVDGVILMLGTNDCKSYYNASPEEIGAGVDKCISEIAKFIEPENILLISPIYLGEDVCLPEKDPEFDKKSIGTSKALKKVYSDIAKKRGTKFIAASDYASPSKVDDEHLSEEGHEKLAQAILEVLKK
ncbi:MAG: arylesterase [Lachnospiraceae bacterium]|nr:arylesterase [Lachnospiraceae bacterium]